MRIIKVSTLREFWLNHPTSEKELSTWIRLTTAAQWTSPAALKQQFGVRVDFVKGASGNTVAVFDIADNNYRMIAAVHFDYPRVFVLRIFDPEEYDQNDWKDEL